MDMNRVVMIGRMTRDAELSYTTNGCAVLKFSLACGRMKRKGEDKAETDFFDVSYFGKGAEAIRNYVSKGKQLAIVGRLQQDRWEKDGQKHSRVSIVADEVQLLGGNSESARPAQQGGFQQDAGGFTEDMPF